MSLNGTVVVPSPLKMPESTFDDAGGAKAEHMVRGHVFVEVEGVKRSVLHAAALSHHAGVLPSLLLQLRP